MGKQNYSHMTFSGVHDEVHGCTYVYACLSAGT